MPLKRDKKFSKIGADLLAMSKVVFKQLQHVKMQLNPDIPNTTSTEDAAQNELILDGFEVKLRRNVVNAMVLYTPRAHDMRKMMTCYDIAINLERMGDLMMNITRHIENININGELYRAMLPKINQLLETTDTMIKNAIYSYSCEDLQLTRSTIDLDDVVDNLFKELRNELLEKTADKSHSQAELRELLSINGLAYNIERIADNATNIVEASIYLIEGRNIQHENSLDGVE